MATAQEVGKFTTAELSCFIISKLTGKVDTPDTIATVMRENKISGKAFLELNADELREMIPVIGERKAVKELLDSFSTKVVSLIAVGKNCMIMC